MVALYKKLSSIKSHVKQAGQAQVKLEFTVHVGVEVGVNNEACHY